MTTVSERDHSSADRTERVAIFFERNLGRILKARAVRTASTALTGEVLGSALARCLVAVRPRNRWPENTRAYLVLRERLGESPLATLTALSAVAATAIYLGFGQAAVAWVGTLLSSM